MLGKIIKLDLKFAYKKFFAMAGILLFFGLILPLIKSEVIKAGFIMVLSAVMLIVVVMSIYLIVQHFNKNLFGPEGYLMFTLPVKSYQLLLSKLITTVIWFNFMILAASLTMLLLFREELTFEIIKGFVSSPEFIEFVKAFVLTNVNVLPLILSIYLGIASSAIAVKSKKLGSGLGTLICLVTIGLYNVVTDKISHTKIFNVTLSSNEATAQATLLNNVDFIANIVLALAFSTIFFLIINYIMKRKVNL